MAANHPGTGNPNEPPHDEVDQLTSRRVVGSYGSYVEAQRAVDYLSDERFPVEYVAIVGEGLRYVERVTGRRGMGRAALQGAASGAIIGALIGFLFGVFSIVEPLVSGLILALWGLVFGTILGAVMGGIGHALTGGRRDFSSVNALEAERYDVVVDTAHAEQAQQLLGRMPTKR